MSEHHYQRALAIDEFWLPAEHFQIDEDSTVITVNGQDYVRINDTPDKYSFATNRVYYDSEWYDDFLLKLKPCEKLHK